MIRKVFVGLVVAAFGLLGSLAPATAATFFDVFNPGLGSFDITTHIDNLDGFDLLSATFDTSGTTASGDGGDGGGTPLTFGGLGGVSDPAGGTSSFTSLTATSWKFDFTSFNDGDSFTFSWDPDTAADGNYGAVTTELVGMTVSLETSGGTVGGTFALLANERGVGVQIESPRGVPEPGSLLLLGLGAGLLALARRKK